MNIKVIVLSFFLFLLPSIIFASNPTKVPSQEADTVEIVAQGVGVDADSALRNAYSNAIQQALGLYVDASTLVANEQIIKDQILTHSRGVVQEVKTISQGSENGLSNVTILARILKQPLIEKVKPIIKAEASFDGRSIHAAVVTEEVQAKDAQALLNEAIKPFLSTDLYKFEFDGDVKLDERDKSTVLVPVKITPNFELYSKEMNNLISVLKQIATAKHDFNKETRRNNQLQYGFENEVRDVITTWLDSEKNQRVFVNIWASPDHKMTKWTGYLLPASCGSEQVTAAIEVGLLDKDGVLMSLGETSLDNIVRFQPSAGYYNGCVFSPYFVGNVTNGVYLTPVVKFMVPVKIDSALLSQVTQLQLEVKYRLVKR